MSVRATAWGYNQLTMNVTLIYSEMAAFADGTKELDYLIEIDQDSLTMTLPLPLVNSGTLDVVLSTSDADS